MAGRDEFDDMEELIHTFTTEGMDLLDEVEPRLIELQEKTNALGQVDGEVLNSIFRIFHTIKGSAGFLELTNLQEVTHEAETLLDFYRKGRLTPNPDHISLLLHTTDFIRKILENIERYMHDKGFEIETGRLVKDLSAVISGQKGAPQAQNPAAKTPEIPAEPTASAAPVKTAENPKPPIPAAPAEIPAPPVAAESVISAISAETPAPPEEAAESAAVVESGGEEFVFEITAEMIDQYTREALDILDGLEQDALELEKNPTDTELVDRVFRALHTIKGNSGLIGFADLEHLSHKTENFFDLIRGGAIRADMENIKMVLSIVDLLRTTVSEIANGGSGKVKGCTVLMGFIDDVIRDSIGAAGSAPEPAPVEEKAAESEAAMTCGPEPEARPEATAKEPEHQEAVSASNPCEELEKQEKTGDPTPRATVRAETAPRVQEAGGDHGAARKDIRVDLDKVDKLVDLVGELALAEMMVVQNPAVIGIEAEEFDRATHHLDRVISELQYVSMSLRMIPIAATFRKLIRLVHDLSYKSGKIVRLVTLGEETEVDKTVVEQIADPLVHIVRNAIDHGIELPGDRTEAGKPEAGTLTIQAKHEGGEVWIEISDDGRGLDREKIFNKAKSTGLVSGEIGDIKDEDLYRLIFEPGFSTAEKVTEVSGRGVGMDVVKRNLEKINGHVDIATLPGKWSRFTLRIPLTLALMDGMLIQVGGTRYLVPLLSIRECIRPLAKDITVAPDGQEIVKVRDELIPVIRLHALHNIVPEHEELVDSLLIVVERRGRLFSIAVDAVLGQQQAVIKGLSDYVGNVRGVSGCTILGDGEVSLILDIGGLMDMISEDAATERVTASV